MEHEEGIRCVGAPIRNHRKEVFAAISVSGPSQRFDPPRIQSMAPLVIETAEEISRKMGYRKRNCMRPKNPRKGGDDLYYQYTNLLRASSRTEKF